MKAIAQRAWREPAVAIGLLATVILLVLKFASGDPWDLATIAGIAAPLVSALGIRQVVSPAFGTPPGAGEAQAGSVAAEAKSDDQAKRPKGKS
jgi:hypothetical protein